MKHNIRICLINNCFPVYSTGTIIDSIYENLNNEKMRIFVAYAWDKRSAEKRYAGVYRYGVLIDKYISALLTRITGCYLGHAYLSTAKLIFILKRIKPHIVHIHCANCYSTNHYILLKWCKKQGIKVIVTEHAEYCHTGNCSFVYNCDKWKSGCGHCPNLYRAVKSRVFDLTSRNWRKMYDAFSGWGRDLVITGVSPWLFDRIRQSPITNRCECFCVENGIDTNVFYYHADANLCGREFGEHTILFVAPKYLSGVKGGEALFELARRLPEYQFAVVGIDSTSDPLPNISYMGYIESREELATLYSRAKLTLLTSKTETFSLVTAESLCCGTPVVGFLCGGAESIAINDYTEFVEQGNIDQLENAVRKWMGRNIDKEKISSVARSRYTYNRMVKEYEAIYERFAECLEQ